MKHHIMALILFLLAGGIVSAQQITGIPSVISYQGIITSSDGTPLIDGEYPITVTIYSDEGGSVSIWQDTYMASVRGGVFNLYLGSGKNPLPAPSQMDKSLWIGTQISGGEEMRPLARLSSSPYAINVPDNAITTAKLADGAVTEEKVDLEYISGVSVNGKKVEIDGRVLNIRGGKDIDINYDEATQSLVIGTPEHIGTSGTGDEKEQDRQLQGTQQDAWTMRGNGVNVITGAVIAPVAGDWIGTNNNVDFNLRVNNLQIMSYQQKIPGTTPNVVGGDVGNSVGANAIGNVIAGGGGVGVNNTIVGNNYNTIGGGISHRIDNTSSNYGAIGGGQNNEIGSATVAATHGTIAGGQGNRVTGNYGAVAGGQSNSVSAAHGTVAGGQSNSVSAAHGAVTGGFTNRIFGSLGTIGGGGNHSILHPSSTYGTIGGGQNNEIGTTTFSATHATIAGGRSNRVRGTYGTVGGGFSNSVGAFYSVVAGGVGNSIDNSYATIGGGANNVITNLGDAATIPGGENLVAQSYAQTVIGALNIPKGNVSPGDPVNDEPIFIIGNGIDGGNPSNAFEVSYNGHSTVFHNTGGATPVVYGATYADNIVYAWGNVDPGGGRICDFGVANVSQLSTGWYQIELDLIDPDGNPIQLNCGSVTATLSSGQSPGSGPPGTCAIVGVSQLQGNVFDVYISDLGCGPIDEFFTFKVTGRP